MIIATKVVKTSLILGIVFLGAVLIAQVQQVRAGDTVSYQDNIVTVTETGFVEVEIRMGLRNTDKFQVLTGKQFIMPLKIVEKPTATLNGKAMSVSTKELENESTEITIDFGGDDIKINQSRTLILKFTADSLYRDFNGSRGLSITADTFGGGSIEVTYPTSLGEPSFLAFEGEQEIVGGTTTITLDSGTGILLLWGDEYYIDIVSKMVLPDADAENAEFFAFNLIANNESQNVAYESFTNATYGAYDAYGFNYALIQVAELKNIGFAGRVEKRNSEVVVSLDKPYDIQLIEDSYFGAKFLSIETEDPELKLKTFYDDLVADTQIDASRQFIGEVDDSVWTIATEDAKLTPAEYCTLLISAAESIGGKGEFEYGYIAWPRRSSYNPHLWCEIEIGDKTILMDPYAEKEFGFSYNGVTTDFDRIAAGIWHPDFTYTNALGLISGDSSLQTISQTTLRGFVDSENQVDISINMPEEIVIGDAIPIELVVKNNTSRFLPVSDLKIDGKSSLGDLVISDQLFPALLPNYESVLPITARNSLFTFDIGEKELLAELFLEDEYVERVFDRESYSIALYTDGAFSDLVYPLVVLGVLTVFMLIYYLIKSQPLTKRIEKEEKPVRYHNE